MRYVRLDDAVIRLGLHHDLVEDLLELGFLHPRPTLERERVIPVEEAEELRVARTLSEELEVNTPGVEIILHMRRRHLELQREMDELVRALRDKLRLRLQEADLLGPRAFLTQG